MSPVESGEKPDDSWTIDQIKTWLDNHGISYSGAKLKDDYLALVP
ncbi:hypothetical protein [Pediococcus pentosaceus]|nr:hypothetical protein [Pediococcus pentosaceus]